MDSQKQAINTINHANCPFDPGHTWIQPSPAPHKLAARLASCTSRISPSLAHKSGRSPHASQQQLQCHQPAHIANSALTCSPQAPHAPQKPAACRALRMGEAQRQPGPQSPAARLALPEFPPLSPTPRRRTAQLPPPASKDLLLEGFPWLNLLLVVSTCKAAHPLYLPSK